MPKLTRPFPRLRIRTILLMVNIIVILVPLSGIYFFKLYQNELVRQTESELIAQGAYIAAMVTHRIPPNQLSTYGALLANPPPKLDEMYHPILPQIDLARTTMLSNRPDAVAPPIPADPVALKIGQGLLPIVEEAKLTTLTGISLMDYRGTVVMGKETGLSLAQLEEVQAALQGQPKSVVRERLSEHSAPALSSISRHTKIRIFMAVPIVHEDRLLGVVLLSRSPRNVLKALYEERSGVFSAIALVLLAVLLISLLTSRAINKPVRALLRQVRHIADGKTNIQPIENPITQELAELSEQIAAMAGKLSERSDYIRNFAMHVSHEFKTPLTAIQGAIELINEHVTSMPPEQLQKFLSNMTQDTDRLKTLVSRLLELARADVMEPRDEQVDLGALLASLRSYYHDWDITVVSRDVEGAMLPLPEDIARTVLGNLIENSHQHGATEVTIRAAWTENALHLTIQDNGTGISPANAHKLFTPFFTTKREQGGTGLGLTMVQSLLATYHAHIRCVPYAHGAHFEIMFPVNR